MKTYKKLLVGSILLLIMGLLVMLPVKTAVANEPSRATPPYTPVEALLDVCVANTLIKGGEGADAPDCQFFDDHLPIEAFNKSSGRCNSSTSDHLCTTMLYGQNTGIFVSPDNIENQYNYVASYTTQPYTVAGAKGSINVPIKITIKDSNNKDLPNPAGDLPGTGDWTFTYSRPYAIDGLDGLKMNFFAYANPATSTRCVRDPLHPPKKSDPPCTGDNRYVLLVAQESSTNNFTILNLVNTDVYQGGYGNAGAVYAYNINKPAYTTDSKGNIVKPNPETPPAESSDGTCGGHGGLNWVFCPLLLAAGDLANNLYEGFTDLLSFNVDQDLGNTNSQASVKQTWSMMRNLATAFLVIIMLIMVFSQAVSAGPFDAYTVRKMLPRLIAVAIAIQLSWAIVAWVIGIFNDLGKGIADIMYYPFGGADKLTLEHLLNNAGVSTAAGAAISWVGIVLVLPILGAAALPAVLVLLLGAVAALFTAYFTLIMRKIIIIALLIFAPIAMLAYVLPNTQKYWKMWYDNLIKILFMFPLIVIMIAAGRIFALIAGGQGGNHTGGALNFILVMVAFFGPLFLLPKTYKWGGQAMSAVSGAVGGISNRYLGRESALGKGAQGLGERTQGRIAKGYNPDAGRTNRFLRRVGSGHLVPFSQRSRRLAIAAGDKWQQEQDEMAQALLKRAGEKVMGGYTTVRRDNEGRALSATRFRRNAAGELLDEDGNVTDDENKAREVANAGEAVATRELTGVAAMKQRWVDIMDDDKADKTLKKMAARQLSATASWPEIQNSFTKNGNRVIDTDAWEPSITTSPEEYPRVLNSRADGAPHVVDAGARRAALPENGGFARNDKSVEAKNMRSNRRIHYAITEQLSNEDFGRQSQGFWQEAARVANLKDASGAYTKQALEVQSALKARFEAIHSMSAPARQSLLGHLRDGGELEVAVNQALGAGKTVGVGTGPASPTTVDDYMQGR